MTRRACAIAGACVLGMAMPSWAQPDPDTISLQLRMVPQIGLPGDVGGVIDLGGTVHQPVTGPGQIRRFEVQYRIIDHEPGDEFDPAGLTSLQMRISIVGGGDAALDFALLSHFETSQAGATPPVSPDLSGPGSTRRPRLHRPFSGGLPGAPDAEGFRLPGPGGPNQVINGITPLSLSQNDQNETSGNAWYGLFSFNYISGSIAAPATITTEILADAVTGNRFGYFIDGDPVPKVNANATGASASVPIPAPGSAAVVMLAAALLGVPARRRRGA
jgi:hypothetical protein